VRRLSPVDDIVTRRLRLRALDADKLDRLSAEWIDERDYLLLRRDGPEDIYSRSANGD
jgi:hypothetical protein